MSFPIDIEDLQSGKWARVMGTEWYCMLWYDPHHSTHFLKAFNKRNTYTFQCCMSDFSFMVDHNSYALLFLQAAGEIENMISNKEKEDRREDRREDRMYRMGSPAEVSTRFTYRIH